MSSADERGHYKASLLADRQPPFIVIHQEHAQVTPGLLLCAIVICPWSKNPQGMTREEAETVGAVQAKLIGSHLAGRFPNGDDYAFLAGHNNGRDDGAGFSLHPLALASDVRLPDGHLERSTS
jgi:hypothetical protein